MTRLPTSTADGEIKLPHARFEAGTRGTLAGAPSFYPEGEKQKSRITFLHPVQGRGHVEEGAYASSHLKNPGGSKL